MFIHVLFSANRLYFLDFLGVVRDFLFLGVDLALLSFDFLLECFVAHGHRAPDVCTFCGDTLILFSRDIFATSPFFLPLVRNRTMSFVRLAF
jgi:hypothetical protein